MLGTLVGHAVWPAPCPAGPAPTQPPEETLLDDAHHEMFAPLDPRRVDAENGKEPRRLAPAGSNRPRSRVDEPGAAGTSEDAVPLRSVAEQMRTVGAMLRRADCGTTTQHAQRQILDDLDRFLREAQSRCQAAQSGTRDKPVDKQPPPSTSPNKPGNQPGTTPGSPGKTGTADAERPETGSSRRTPEQRRVMLKELWGELPPRERQKMMQLPVEEFLPRYELLIEEYFRRLSEEKKKGNSPRQRTNP